MFTSPVFRFKGCLRTKRFHSSARLAASVRPASVDDISLIPLFDRLNSTQPRNSRRTPGGLCNHPLLHTPSQFRDIAALTLSRAQRLVNRILCARSSRSEMFKVVKNLDRLSDMLCSVIDLAELVRNAHPDAIWVDSANEAYEMLCEFMNVLNTHVGLYEACQH